MLNRTDIDWDGNCNFEDGKVVSFKIANAANHYQMRPIPSNDRAINDAREAKKVIEAIMQPASYEQMVVVFKKLSSHCGKVNKSPEDIKYMFNDYYHDLKKYPIKLIEGACEAYRKLPEDNAFMPTSGKLIALMAEPWHAIKRVEVKINKILGLHVEPAMKQNKMLSLDEALAKLL